jgi:hypothetical protein
MIEVPFAAPLYLAVHVCLSDNACDLLVWALVAGYYDKLTSNINTVRNGGPTSPPTAAPTASLTAWTASLAGGHGHMANIHCFHDAGQTALMCSVQPRHLHPVSTRLAHVHICTTTCIVIAACLHWQCAFV